MNTYTLVIWSEFARNGRELRKRLMSGEQFAISFNGRIVARLEPEDTATVEIPRTVELPK